MGTSTVCPAIAGDCLWTIGLIATMIVVAAATISATLEGAAAPMGGIGLVGSVEYLSLEDSHCLLHLLELGG